MARQKGDQSSPGSDAQQGPNSRSVTHSLTKRELAADTETLAALGNDTRYEALRLISEADDDVCVCELEPSLGVSQGAVSQALSRLYSAGLVERRKKGRWRYYSSTPRANQLLDVLTETRASTLSEE